MSIVEKEADIRLEDDLDYVRSLARDVARFGRRGRHGHLVGSGSTGWNDAIKASRPELEEFWPGGQQARARHPLRLQLYMELLREYARHSAVADEPINSDRFVIAKPNGRLTALREESEQYRPNRSADEPPPVPVVRISALLKKSSIVLAVLCLVSMAYWALSGTIIVNPFLSLLMLIASPFVFFMGGSIEKGENDRASGDSRI